ncbi:MAG: hypothetical protein SGJ09_06505 [Phycisphaerae bacterium]|nr:hypothetical protein [Phycisphaerae bacterium]
MPRFNRSTVIVLMLPLAVLAAGSGFGSGDGGVAVDTFSIDWHTIDGGGGVSTSAALELSGTIGQPDAGVLTSAAGFELVGGFWSAPNSSAQLGDLNGDGLVNPIDLGILLGEWGVLGGVADLNGDGVVGSADIGILLGEWTG